MKPQVKDALLGIIYFCLFAFALHCYVEKPNSPAAIYPFLISVLSLFQSIIYLIAANK